MSNERTPAPAPAAPVQRAPSGAAATAPGGVTQLRASLRGMSFAAGEAALAPVQMHEEGDHAEDADPGDDVPADLDGERPVDGTVPQDIRDRIMVQLRLSPRVVQVLDDIAANGGADFPMKWSARGNTHSNGTIRLDRRNTIQRWVPSMMHELNHLADQRRGNNPTTSTSPDRETFVRQKMDNEVRAHAIGYVGQIEQANSDGAAALQPSTGFNAFKAHLDGLEAAEQACFTSERIQSEAETWLAEQYRTNPVFQTSNTSENYYDYWGRIWDEAHPAGP